MGPHKGPGEIQPTSDWAVRTEDHPFSYSTFEGTIPQGEYGGGTVMLWDRGTWQPEGDPDAGLEKGHLFFTLRGDRLKDKWNLIRMRGTRKRENWLLIKQNDEEAQNKAINALKIYRSASKAAVLWTKSLMRSPFAEQRSNEEAG